MVAPAYPQWFALGLNKASSFGALIPVQMTRTEVLLLSKERETDEQLLRVLWKQGGERGYLLLWIIL